MKRSLFFFSGKIRDLKKALKELEEADGSVSN